MKRKCLGLAFALGASPLLAQPAYINVSVATTQSPGNGGAISDMNTFSLVFNRLQWVADTTTVQYHPNLAENPGPNTYLGSTVGSMDNIGFRESEKVLEINVKGSRGTNTFYSGQSFSSGSPIVTSEINYVLNNFWWFDRGGAVHGTSGEQGFHDLSGLTAPVVLRSKVIQNTDQIQSDFSSVGSLGPVDIRNQWFTVRSTHDGSINFAVPEPKSLLFLGFGLVLFPLFRRRFFPKFTV